MAIASLVGLSGSVAYAAPAAPTSSNPLPFVGQEFILSGDIGTATPSGRPVEVQKLSSGKWSKLTSGKTLADGTYALKASTTAPERSFRIYAASVKASGGNPALTSLTSDPITVQTQKDSVSLNIARIGNNFKASGVVSPVIPGRLFALQYKSGSKWVQVSGTDKIEATGGNLAWTSPVVGSKSYRIAGDAGEGTSTVYSSTIAFNPGPTVLGKNVIYATTDSGKTPTKKGVDYTGTATLVSGDTASEAFPLETIAVRGNSTATKVKKPYKLKFAVKQKPFGMKSDKTWVLLANYGDRTLVRSKVAWNLGAQLDGLKWTPDSVFTELFLNGKYLGSYQLVQSIKIDSNRVKVDKVTGQVMEFDPHWKDGDGTFGFTGFSGQDFSYKDPDELKKLPDNSDDPESLTAAKKAALKTKVTNFEEVLYGFDKKRDWSNTKADTYAPGDPNDWTTYLDMNSAVDYYLAREFTKDNDADFYRSNFFYTNNADPASADKFFMGPIWDFDRSAGAATGSSTSIASPTGWWIRGNGSANHNTNKIHWYTRIVKDPRFLNALHDRWAAKAASFDAVSTTGVTDAVTAMGGTTYESGLDVAANDRKVWSSGGSRYGTHSSTYTGELSYLKDWYHKRYVWMNAELIKTPPALD